MNLLFFHPLYKERVWGGNALATALGRRLPGTRPIGESWDVVDRDDDQSVVRCGPWAGLPLRHLLRRFPTELMGPAWPAGRPFPILVKWLDCRQRLSLQVHPPAASPPALPGEEPKTENWFVAQAAPGSGLFVGLKKGTTRPQFEQHLREGTAEPLLHRFPVQPGSSILVESGRLHAIDAGNLILEIQQNSDTTYRVYDWGRTGLDGKPRTLHPAESLRSINFNDFEPSPLPPSEAPGETVLADCREFRIRRFNLAPDEPLHLPANPEPRLIHGVSGGLTFDPPGESLAPGDTALLPCGCPLAGRAAAATTLLVTDRFTRPEHLNPTCHV